MCIYIHVCACVCCTRNNNNMQVACAARCNYDVNVTRPERKTLFRRRHAAGDPGTVWVVKE